MAKMDEELKAMRTCVSALDGLPEDDEARARVAAYVFDRYVAQGIQSRALRHAIDTMQGAVERDHVRRDSVARVVDDLTSVNEPTGIEIRFEKNGFTRIVDGKAKSEQWWTCRECGGASPHREWLPTVIEVVHESGCNTGKPDDDGFIEV
jgi:hypothetical protein